MSVKAISAVERLQVVADAEGLTSRAGTALVAGVADRVGLTAGLSGALVGLRERSSRHDPGRIVRDLALTLADGGDCLADLRVLRDQQTLFGEVASDATAWRTVAALDERPLRAIRAARADARRRVWERAGSPKRVILDFDGTLLTAHSDKEGAAGTYKGGFGFHPLLCYEATTQEALAGILRPGNAGFNTASDHIELLEHSLAQLPEEAIGPGLLVRCDRAGATHAFLDQVASRGLRFSVGLDLTEPVREAILALPERAWQPAAAQDGEPRAGAWVAELSLELSGWPAGTRAICRRERPHPGAQLSFTDEDGYRFQVFLTNQQGRRIARLEQLHRARAACEDRIRCGKETGLRNLPFRSFQANAAWLELVLIGQDLLCWTQRLLLADTELARCEPKRLRYRLLHVAARLTRHARRLVLHLPRAWPWRRELLRAFERLRALPA
ncbi:MAG TPA: IS1380 family transposase [Solirubrobacterales bacterium]|nr:IS1380 family transposase [Solirubrobacterales bacterium]